MKRSSALIGEEKPKRGWGLATRFVAASCGLLALGIAVFAALTVQDQARLRRAELELHARTLAGLVQRDLCDGLYELDVASLRASLASLRNHDLVKDCLLLDANGHVITDGSENNERRHEKLQLTDPSPTPLTFEEREDHLLVTQSLSLGGERLGTLQIELCLARLESELSALRRRAFGLGALFLILGFAATLVLVQRVIAPLTQVVAATNRIASGDFGTRLPTGIGGTLQPLTNAVNEMAERLHSTAVSKSHLNEVIDSMSDPLVVLSASGSIETCNRATGRLLDRDLKEIRGQALSLLFGNELPEVLVKTLRHSEDARDCDVELIAADGRRIPALFASSILHDDEGSPRGRVCVATEISTIKEAQREIEKARDAALDVAELKSQFLANTSHEIRTPMNGVIGMARVLLDTDLSPEQRDYVETIIGSGDALISIINEILDFSKLEAGKVELDEIPFDLPDLVDDIAELLSETAQSKAVTLIAEIGEGVPERALGDAGRLRQVLTNLLGNAIKFTDEGRVRFGVRKAGESLLFEVEDSGVGMKPEALEHIFYAFQQADGSTTRTHGGTGLGLSISQQLVELMGGHIEVSSTEGEGSCFWFSLEMKALDAEAPLEGSLSGISVALASADPDYAPLLRSYCEGFGLKREELSGTSTSADLAIADFDFEGPSIIAELRKRQPDLPIILLANRRDRAAAAAIPRSPRRCRGDETDSPQSAGPPHSRAFGTRGLRGRISLEGGAGRPKP